ncbi:MAG: glucose-6-phosphate dehydrogenase [Candidatus Sumerlaeia bacterium]
MNKHEREELQKMPLSIVVIGGSGDLAKKKIFPALFSLHSQDLLPENVHFYGLSRTEYTDEEFREHLMQNLTCRYVPEQSCEEKMHDFLSRCHYQPGNYDSTESFLALYQCMKEHENGGSGKSASIPANRMFYMAIPPFLFMKVAQTIGAAGLVNCGELEEGWSRVVIEKPFGHDRESSDELVEQMGQVFSESQTYRIDHYLGKELIQNMLALRFANSIFEPLWNSDQIESVEIAFREDFGVQGRVGYFDSYGIIRDVIQNHLLQVMALLCMERPGKFEAKEIRDEKVRLVRQIKILHADDFVLGQYGACDEKNEKAYREVEDIPGDTRTPTFAATVLKVDSERWKDVPFLISAGKGLDKKKTEIHIRFRSDIKNIYPEDVDLERNELVIRVQPDEAIWLRINNKVPGQQMRIAATDLNLSYASTFNEVLPEAYESLLLDVIRGDKSLFIRSDELEAAWDIFTPALHEIDRDKIEPEEYRFGTTGPEGYLKLRRSLGI